MNIINIGGWYVGNSAILDWMDGFDELAFIKGDFNIARLENGIMDMILCKDKDIKLSMINYNKMLCYKSIYLLTRRFIGKYTKHLLKSKKSVNSHYDYFNFYKLLYLTLKKYEKKILNNSSFDEVVFWKDFLSNLPSLDSKYKKYKHIVYQNPFFYDETFDGHKEIWPQLFHPYKMMFIHRDPLDQFSDIVNAGGHLMTSWARFHGGTEHMHPADRFLTIAKKLYSARLRMAEKCDKNNLVIFSFEDFLKNHERVVDKLKPFLDITSERDPLNKRFVLEKSLKNIGKGKHNIEALNLLKEKNYVIDELNMYRDKLINHKLAL